MNDETYKRWFDDEGDKTHRINYDLNNESLVFDVGGYTGIWSETIFNKYNCNIYIFEPIIKYYEILIDKFKNNDKIQIFNFGLSNENKISLISILEDSSSVYKITDNMVNIQLVDIHSFIIENGIKKIDLIKINTEGEEYSILNRIFESGISRMFSNIQIQFHLFIDDAQNKRQSLRNKFFSTHNETYCYDFIWENWEIKKDMYFYNLFHNGDIHFSRNFIKDIIKKTKCNDYYFIHSNKKGILKDIDINEIIDNNIQSDDFYYNELVNVKNNNYYVNTWIGQKNYTLNGINIHTFYEMYKDIYSILNIELENVDYYLPTIDFNKIDKKNIDVFLKKHKKKKVLLCNNKVLSEQSYAEFDIERITNDFKDVDFILTEKIDINKDNVFFTDDIIEEKPDLCEISYLSKHCDLIIGRESGPFAFCYILDNFQRDVNMISFSRTQSWTFYPHKNIQSFQDIDTYDIIKSVLSKNDIEISIITGSLNRLDILKIVIDNTVKTNSQIELIILDGGSSDGTIEYIKSLNNKQINLIEIGERSSYPHFMNIGLKNAKSDWIVQWNDDVLLVNNWYDVIKLSKSNESDVYIFDWTRGNIQDFYDNRENMNPSTFGSYWIHFHDCMNFGLYKKSIFKEIGMYDNKFKYYECDHDMTTRCKYFNYKVVNRHDIKVFEINTEKRSIDYDGDRNLYLQNLDYYRNKILPNTIEKL